ncbi:hypothetical protein CIG75_08040 [Tumebacillus algifaecis]|uniref:G5 domain-containing protein n=1 Tax=Tumebacillus algifaecis TaxID=1214604 RepID=A0A223D0Q5_9BACL|nr:3D domain-containing protein [Tumebacillus algifaecis]ASS74937.1 hypothetical protein CIG75_08040 [Tumebacillus algifaecis]
MQKVNRKSVYCLSAGAIALLLGGVVTATSTYKTITLDVDGQKQEISGFQLGSVGELLREQGVAVETGDLVQPATSDALAEGTIITVKHAKSVQIQDGTKELVSVKTQAGTIEELIKELSIKLNTTDKTSLALSTSIENGQKLTITRRTEEVQIAEETIPFQTERQPDADMYTGTEKVLTSGVEGKAKITTKIVFENGKEVDRKEDRTVVNDPVNQVVTYGTQQRPIVVASRSGANLTASKVLTMAASAYSMPGGRTATGGSAGQGTIAVDPSVIPLGTKMYIEGYGYGVASDVGGAIKGNRIDLHFDTREQALQFGRRAVQVYILN